MLWFRKTDPHIAIEQHRKSTVEIVAHKNATEEAKKEVDEANQKIQDLFEHNHFTVKIYLAGGKKPKTKRKGNE